MRRSTSDITGQIAALQVLPREELAVWWQKAHGSAPPKGVRHELLVRSAAWHLQVKHFGGLSPATRRALQVAMTEVKRGMRGPPPAVTISAESTTVTVTETPVRRLRGKLAPGARLLRDWNGTTHVVDVIENGFVFRSKVYTSLTTITRQITGAHWSGPRFFGL